MFCLVDVLNLLYNFVTAPKIVINVMWFFFKFNDESSTEAFSSCNRIF